MRWLFAIMHIVLSLFAIAQDSAMTYKNWSDSISLESYIGMKIILDELVVVSKSDIPHDKRILSTDLLMHDQSGVNMIRRGSFANEPMLRGLTSDRYQMTIDGMRIFGACTDKMDPPSAYVEPINLESVKIEFGSSVTGISTSTGGAVDFRLKKPVFNNLKPFAGAISLIGGSAAGSFDQATDINWSGDRLAIRLSGTHRAATNYRDGSGSIVRYSQYEKWNYAASMSYRFDEGLISLDYLGDDAIDVGYPALPMDVSSAKADLIGLTYIAENFGPFLDPEIKLYYNQIKHIMDDTKRDSVWMHMDMPGNTWTTGGYLSGHLMQSDRQSLSLRADYYQTFAHAEMTMYPNEPGYREMFMLTWPDVHRSVYGSEANFHQQWQKLQYDGRVRLDWNSTHISSQFGEQQLGVFGMTGIDPNYHLTYSGSISVVRKWNQAKQTGFSASYSSRIGTFTELYGFYLFNRLDGFDYIGNPDLLTEKNLHLEVFHAMKSDQLSGRVNLFSYLFDDYIMGIYDPELSVMTEGALGVKRFVNKGQANMIGGEIAGIWKPLDYSSFELSLKSVYGWDFEKEPLPQMPPLKATIRYRLEHRGWFFTPEWVWSSAQDRISTKFKEQATTSFLLINMHLQKQINIGDTKLIFLSSVDNLTDVSYREHFDIGQILRPGRNISLGLKYNY